MPRPLGAYQIGSLLVAGCLSVLIASAREEADASLRGPSDNLTRTFCPRQGQGEPTSAPVMDAHRGHHAVAIWRAERRRGQGPKAPRGRRAGAKRLDGVEHGSRLGGVVATHVTLGGPDQARRCRQGPQAPRGLPRGGEAKRSALTAPSDAREWASTVAKCHVRARLTRWLERLTIPRTPPRVTRRHMATSGTHRCRTG